MVQLSYSYVTTGKTVALTIQAFVEKVMSLLFNMLSRFFLPFLLFPSLPFPSLFFLHLCPSLSLFFFLTPTCNCSQYREAKCTDEKTLLQLKKVGPRKSECHMPVSSAASSPLSDFLELKRVRALFWIRLWLKGVL